MDAALSDNFKLLSVEARLRIVKLLRERPSLCVKAIAAHIGLPITAPALSQHLRLLKAAGWLNAEKKGSFIHYSLDKTKFGRFENQLGEFLSGPPVSRKRPHPKRGGEENVRR